MIALALGGCTAPPSTGEALGESPLEQNEGPVPRIEVPFAVLVPSDPELRAAMQVLTGPVWYSVTIEREGANLLLQATNVEHAAVEGPVEWPEQTETVRGHRALHTINEGIGSVAWTEGGVAYVVEADCEAPFADPRCTEPDFLVAFADGLVAQ